MGNVSGKMLLIGAGDIGRRMIGSLGRRNKVIACTSTPAHRAALRRIGAEPRLADLDKPGSLARLPRDWHALLHCAPPPPYGRRDSRTRNLLRVLARTTPPKPTPPFGDYDSNYGGHRASGHKRSSLSRSIVYLSTSGVYGDCAGQRVGEARRPDPQSPRAVRRVDAERALIRFARRTGVRLTILRVPGIYAADRLPLARLKAGTPAIVDAEDGYTNHIHADDLAALALRALARMARRLCPQVRVYNASDDSELKMGQYFDLVAEAFGLAAPPRLPRAQIKLAVSPMLYSFMRESRRLDNTRLKRELRPRFQFPTVAAGLTAARTTL